jgi:hypothetical protein
MYQRASDETEYQEARTYEGRIVLPCEYFEDSLLIPRAYQRPKCFQSVHIEGSNTVLRLCFD